MVGAQYIPLRQFSKTYGIPVTTVQKAVQSGRITAIKKTPAGRIAGIDKDLGIQQYNDNTDPVQSARSKAPEDKTTYQQSRATRESWQAKTAELEYLEKAGKLVSTEDTEKQMTEIIMLLKGKVFRLPDQLSQELAGITVPKTIEKILRKRLTIIFEEASNDLENRFTNRDK